MKATKTNLGHLLLEPENDKDRVYIEALAHVVHAGGHGTVDSHGQAVVMWSPKEQVRGDLHPIYNDTMAWLENQWKSNDFVKLADLRFHLITTNPAKIHDMNVARVLEQFLDEGTKQQHLNVGTNFYIYPRGPYAT